MKVQPSVRALFDQQLVLNRPLKRHVDETMKALCQERWHYESRLKSLDSFAAKLETGRVPDPKALEDFLGCMIVVPATSSIQEALSLVAGKFEIKTRRPPLAGATTKPANAFPFDDLRLYCRRQNAGSAPKDPIDTLIFEVQIKTFLQHAWSMATHDLSYKTSEISWGKDRVVAHLKAALEHVELSLQEASLLAASTLVSLANPATTAVADVASVLKKHWAPDDLPENLRGLAETIASILAETKLSADELNNILLSYGTSHNGLPLNLSPYAIIVAALIDTALPKLSGALEKSGKIKLLITPELTLPNGFPSEKAKARIVQV